MLYLILGFSVVWVCHFAYLLVISGQVRQLQRRLEARTPDGRRRTTDDSALVRPPTSGEPPRQ